MMKLIIAECGDSRYCHHGTWLSLYAFDLCFPLSLHETTRIELLARYYRSVLVALRILVRPNRDNQTWCAYNHGSTL